MIFKFTKYILFFFIFIPCTLYALNKEGNFESKAELDNFISTALKKTAKEMNSQTPIMIDADTQMNYVLVLDKTMNITMRLINLSSTNADINYINKYVWNNLNDLACKSEATRRLIDYGVTYVFIYFGNDNHLITRVVLDKYDCNK